MKRQGKSLAVCVSASVVSTLSASSISAADNPFLLKDLENGYARIAEAAAQGQEKSQELKCGAEAMKNNPELKCGASMMDVEKPDSENKALDRRSAGDTMDKEQSAAPKPTPAASPKPITAP